MWKLDTLEIFLMIHVIQSPFVFFRNSPDYYRKDSKGSKDDFKMKYRVSRRL